MTRIQWFRRTAATLLAAGPLAAQPANPRLPVIDVHVHAMPAAAASWPKSDSQYNVRYRMATVMAGDLAAWQAVESSRFLPALSFPCPGGRAAFTGVPCFATATELPDTGWLRRQIGAKRIGAFAELVPQFLGWSPADPRLEPYWSLAEEFDLPVGVHMGPAPPGAAYPSNSAGVSIPQYRAAMTAPMLLEEVLLRHKRLRFLVMHAGWPALEPIITLLHAHPGVYVDVGLLQREDVIPRAAYYRFLRSLVEAGFAGRIVFGSDSPAAPLGPGIDAIMAADFLTLEQKADILCGNAMRFLRLPQSTCTP